MQPKTDADWTIHSINIQGVFFERSCQDIVDKSRWTLKATNLPVVFPPPNAPFRGEESNLDILAEYRDDVNVATLLVECKKNNPEFVNWVFIPRPTPGSVLIREVIKQRVEANPPGSTLQPRFQQYVPNGVPMADEARETRQSYADFKKKGEMTRTSNKAVSEAAYQVALATHALLYQEAKASVAMPFDIQTFLPVIVTTARLFTCEFDARDVDVTTGELPLKKAKLTARPYLFYEYALPPHLQLAPPDGLVVTRETWAMTCFWRMHILVVQSDSFADVLRQLFTDSAPILGFVTHRAGFAETGGPIGFKIP
jgi:hypothetical protein